MKILTDEQRLKNKEYQKNYRIANREKLAAYDEFRRHKKNELSNIKRRQHRVDNPEFYANLYQKEKEVRNYRRVMYSREKLYNTKEEDLQRLMTIQRGCCKICGESLIFPDSKRSYAVDHCHISGRVRGLLCSRCNLTIGLVSEDVSILKAMVDYVESNLVIAEQ